MSRSTTILFAGATPDSPIQWLQLRPREGPVQARGVIPSGGGLPADANADVVLVLQGSEAQLRRLELKARTEAQARGAAAFLFEGGVARDPEAMMYAVGSPEAPGNMRLAAAMDRRRLREWIRRCETARAKPRAIYLDCALLDPGPGIVRMLEHDGRVIVCGGRRGGFTIETALAPAVLRAWLKGQFDAVSEVRIEGESLSEFAEIVREAGLAVSHEGADDSLSILARAAVRSPEWTPDLRQGEFALRERTNRNIRTWGALAALAVLAVAVQTGNLVLQGLRDQKTAQALEAQVEDRFRKLRPDVSRIVNLRAQVSAALNAARPPAVNPVIATGKPVVEFLRAHPDIRLEEVRFEAPGRTVSMRFSGAAPGPLEAAIGDLRTRHASLSPGQMQVADGRASLTVEMQAP